MSRYQKLQLAGLLLGATAIALFGLAAYFGF